MRNLVASRGFALADLACVVSAAAWWVLAPQVGACASKAGAWPLIIALIPWGFRLAAGKFPVRRTPLDIPLVVFLLTAGVGIWTAYDRTAAWDKFWMIVAAVLLYYALAGQRWLTRSNGWLVAGLAGLLGASLSVYFLLTNDWKLFPADLSILNRLGLAWMNIRPDVRGPVMQPNIAGGILAMLMPVNLAWGINAWQKRSRSSLLAALGLNALLAAGLLMTSSRAAWAALVVGLGMWGWWLISGCLAAKRLARSRAPALSRALTFGLPILLVAFLALGVFGLRGGSLVRAANTLPGEADAGSRVEITRNTIQLVRDYPYTGGGLASFPALYSTYIRVIQVPEFFYSHNLYIDIALEQGLPGLAAFLILMAGTVWILIISLVANPSRNHLAGASLAGLTVVLLHGFVDDALYGMGGTPLIFLIPGIVASLPINFEEGVLEPKGGNLIRRKLATTKLLWGVGSAVVVLGFLGVLFAKPLASAWYANLGAVAMTQLHLVVWPESLTETRTTPARIEPIIDLFNRALEQNPSNPTALYRLGIFAYNSNEFTKAAGYLGSAYAKNRGHRGIQKLLGYTYTWNGDTLNAKALLAKIPEAGYEMSVYTWWWGTQNRANLAEFANQMVAQLQQR